MLLLSRYELSGDGQSCFCSLFDLASLIFVRGCGRAGWFWFVKFLVLMKFTCSQILCGFI